MDVISAADWRICAALDEDSGGGRMGVGLLTPIADVTRSGDCSADRSADRHLTRTYADLTKVLATYAAIYLTRYPGSTRRTSQRWAPTFFS